MRKYNGTLIYQSHDADGIIEVVESEGIRSLHFGSSSKQSSVLLSDPNYPYLSYIRAMLCWQLFSDRCQHILMIGLGGGSLAKYLLQSFSDVKIVAIETRRSVVKIARRYFGLPLDNRLKIIIGDGGEFIRKTVQTGQRHFDLLLIDAFDHDTMSSTVFGQAFYDACRQLLSRQGVMAINLWQTDEALFDLATQQLKCSFNSKIIYLPVHDRSNLIAFGFAEGVTNPNYKTLKRKTALLKRTTGIEFSVFLKDFRKYNISAKDCFIRF